MGLCAFVVSVVCNCAEKPTQHADKAIYHFGVFGISDAGEIYICEWCNWSNARIFVIIMLFNRRFSVAINSLVSTCRYG